MPAAPITDGHHHYVHMALLIYTNCRLTKSYRTSQLKTASSYLMVHKCQFNSLFASIHYRHSKKLRCKCEKKRDKYNICDLWNSLIYFIPIFNLLSVCISSQIIDQQTCKKEKISPPRDIVKLESMHVVGEKYEAVLQLWTCFYSCFQTKNQVCLM